MAALLQCEGNLRVGTVGLQEQVYLRLKGEGMIDKVINGNVIKIENCH